MQDDNNNIEVLDLSANTELENLTITGSNSLYSITLPKTQTLETLNISNNPALTILDLSPASVLQKATITNNGIAQLDFSQNTFLNELNISGNKLYSLDTSKCPKLGTIYAQNNKIYEFNIVEKTIEILDLSGNKLREFNGSNMKVLESLDVSDNMLESINLPTNETLTYLNVNENHLASIDLTDVMDENATRAPTVVTGTQSLFAGDEDDSIDLKSYDENFDSKKATIVDSDTGLATGDKIPTSGVITFPDSDSTNNGGTNQKPLVEEGQFAVLAQLAGPITEQEISVEISERTLGLTGADFTVSNVKGSAQLGSKVLPLNFAQDENNPEKWVATPENSPESEAEAALIMLEDVEAKTWSEKPENVMIKGQITVSAQGKRTTQFDFKIGSKQGNQFLKEGTLLEGKVENGTAITTPNDGNQESTATEITATDVVAVFDKTTDANGDTYTLLLA